jgi:cyclopropane-fatty-acyl-phospholipid synthase
MDGHWTADDLTTLVRIVARNQDLFYGLDGGAARLVRIGLRGLHALRRNTRTGSRRNIAAHYDLGNDFFSLFLDPSWTYSCAIFENAEASLEEASIAKYDRACKKLELVADDHVLEIGGGWGGFALHAAERYGCRVTTITLSREQHVLASERVARAGLADRVDVRLEDYREARGTYDKLVSIEMIEAVGHRYFDQFFRICSERLRPSGLMLLQAILTPDQGYAQSVRNVDFIKRYIFPGGQLPSLVAITGSVRRETDLRLIHLEDLTAHYARTLASWRERMLKNLDRIRDLGLPESFLRMWEFYLCYCEGGFAERANSVAQILFEKPRGRREPVLGSL